MRLDFPLTEGDVQLTRFGATANLLKQYIGAVYLIEKNVNIYVSGNRVYTFKGWWRLAKTTDALEKWVDSIYGSFKEFLESKESEIRSLSHGNAKWERIRDLYLKNKVLEYFGRRKARSQFDAMAILRSVSTHNAHLRIRRRNLK